MIVPVWAIETGGTKREWREIGRAEVHEDLLDLLPVSFTLNSMPLLKYQISEDKPQPSTNGGHHAGSKKSS